MKRSLWKSFRLPLDYCHFISLIPMGIFSSMILKRQAGNAYYVVHKTIGLLYFFGNCRLIWNKISKRPALDNTLTSTEKNWLTGYNILYFMLLVIPITGFMMTVIMVMKFFFFWELPPYGNKVMFTKYGCFHKYLLPYIVYKFSAHVLGALNISLLINTIVVRMVS